MDVKTSADADLDSHDGLLSLARELKSALEAEQVPDHLLRLAEELAAALLSKAGGE